MTNHDLLVDRISEDLKIEGEKICSPRSWIRGPAEVDIIAFSEPSAMSHPLPKVIEVKTSIPGFQGSLCQLLVARECLHKDRHALFWINGFAWIGGVVNFDEIVKRRETLEALDL